MTGRPGLRALIAILTMAAATDAAAQFAVQTPRPQPPRPAAAPAPPQTSLRGFADIGITAFTAADSFEATLGSSAGVVFGGGAEIVLPQQFFFGVRVSRFQADGERVFVNGGQVFGLGIPLTVKVTPLLVTGGYRWARPRAVLLPYLGAGIGWHRYEETSDFADESETVSEVFTGFHVLGGAEYRLSALVGLAGEAEWATVRDALGQNPVSASAAFDETNLGGLTVRVKVVIGR